MKNLKKLVIASFMLVIAFVAVVSSTYAWFTKGQDATVQNITVGVVDANKALLISKDNTNWARQLSFGYDGKITPVTLEATAGDNNTYNTPVFKQIVWSDNLVPYYASVSALTDNTLAAYEQYTVASSFDANAKYYSRTGEGTDASPYAYAVDSSVTADNFATGTHYVNKADEAGYIQMELYFQIIVSKASDWAGHLYMNLTDVHAYNYNAAGTEVDTNSPNYEAESSFRMAVVYNGNIEKILKKADQTVQSVNYNGHYGEGKQFAKDSGWMKKMAEAANADNKFVELEENATSYTLLASRQQAVYGKEADINDGNQENTSTPVYEYDLVTLAEEPSTNADCVYESQDGLTRTYHLTLLVWMEGWDGDNTNAAAKCAYRFGLSFRAE